MIGGEGQTYTVRAVAVDKAGNSATATATVTIDNTAPAGPVVSFRQNPVTGSPTLTWANVSGETYHVARTSSTGPGPKAFILPVTPDWTDPDTLPPGTYTYVVTATDSVGNSTSSAPAFGRRDRTQRHGAAVNLGHLADQYGAAPELAATGDVRRDRMEGLPRWGPS